MSKIKLFSKEGCPGCFQVEEFMETHEIEHEVLDVIKSSEARWELIGAGFMSVPVAEIDGEMFHGADRIIKRLLEG